MHPPPSPSSSPDPSGHSSLMLKRRRTLEFGKWGERGMAAIALLNLLLVAFDGSYIPFRSFYLRLFPSVTLWYGERFKGIEPHRDTTAYLHTVDTLKTTSLEELPQSEDLLRSLRLQSIEIIDQDPFESANQSGSLEKIKNRMRDRMQVASSKQAFVQFWSREHLSQVGEQDAFAFFDRSIRPLMAANYYRGIDESGQTIDQFWQIDLVFITVFAIELALRGRLVRRRAPHLSWLDIILQRWYDLFLLLPFARWLRVIPVTLRLEQGELIDLTPLRVRVTQDFVSGMATELTERVVVTILEQLQTVLREDKAARWFAQMAAREYIDLNGINEVEAIAHQILAIALYQVLPQIRPEVEATLRYAIRRVLQDSPMAGFAQLPGVKDWQEQVSDRLVNDLTRTAYITLTQILEDEQLLQHVHQLVQKSSQAVLNVMLQPAGGPESPALQNLQILLVDLLEEIKVSYIQQVEADLVLPHLQPQD